VEVVASLSQGRTAAAQCGLFTHKSVPVIFEPPCTSNGPQTLFSCGSIYVGELKIGSSMTRRGLALKLPSKFRRQMSSLHCILKAEAA